MRPSSPRPATPARGWTNVAGLAGLLLLLGGLASAGVPTSSPLPSPTASPSATSLDQRCQLDAHGEFAQRCQSAICCDLDGLALTALSTGALDGLPPELIQLELGGNLLSVLPAGVFGLLTRLEQLGLQENLLTALEPEVFGALSRLKVLYLSINHLPRLPDGIFDGLSDLEHLRLDANALTVLPDRLFRSTTMLRVAFIHINPLSVLPRGVFDTTTRLEHIALYQTRLTTVHAATFAGLVALCELELQDSRLTMVEIGAFDTLGNLTALDLENNDLTALPHGVFDRLSRLTHLSVDRNRLSALEDGAFDQLIALGNFQLDHNQLTAVPDYAFDRLSSLASLDLSVNRLSVLPDGLFDSLTGLNALVLNNNDIVALPSGLFDALTSLSTLYLSHSQLSVLPHGLFDSLTGLGILFLNDNDIVALQGGLFGALTSLRTLYLHDNRVSVLPDGLFDSLTGLILLFLNDNDIVALPSGLFGALTSLRTLDLARNRVSVLPDGLFDSLTGLVILRLNRNSIPKFQGGLFDALTRLQTLTVAGNLVWGVPQALFDPLLPSVDVQLWDGPLICNVSLTEGFVCHGCHLQLRFRASSGCFICLNEQLDRAQAAFNSDCQSLQTIAAPTTAWTTARTSLSDPASAGSAGSDDASIAVVVVVVVLVLVLLVVVPLGVVHHRRRALRVTLTNAISAARDVLLNKSEETFSRLWRELMEHPEAPENFEQDFMRRRTSPTQLTDRREVSRGPFGVVFKANLKLGPPTPTAGATSVVVAAKFCHVGDTIGCHRLLVEARLLLRLRHPAILPLLAYHASSSRPWLCTAFAKNGDLKTHLRALRQTHAGTADSKPLTDVAACAIGCRISEAMIYLQRVGVIHGDIAARNVLVGAGGATDCYLADFGASVPAGVGALPDDIYSANATLPFRWMAPEALLESAQTHKTDAWAFGILLWEVLSLGKTPYGALGFHEVKQLLLAGDRLTLPPLCCAGLYRISSSCWETSPILRLGFVQIRRQLGVLRSELGEVSDSGTNILQEDSLAMAASRHATSSPGEDPDIRASCPPPAVSLSSQVVNGAFTLGSAARA